jgi:hypothetical protein
MHSFRAGFHGLTETVSQFLIETAEIFSDILVIDAENGL